MIKHYVYELINLLGTIEYVGESKNPYQRFNSHTKVKPGKAMGKFYGRQDLTLNIVKEFNNRKDAYQYQCELQSKYGLITDRELSSQSMKGKSRKPFSIEHRQKIGDANRKRIYSAETLKKMSDARKLYHSSRH
jgi:predicted GIY-YIG superfamily endonuclease